MSVKQFFLALLSFAVALLLLVALFASVDIHLEQIIQALWSFPLHWFLCIIILNFLAIFLSQERWRYLQHYYHIGKPMSRASGFLYTCIGQNLSQLIPPQMSIAIARSSGSWIEKTSKPLHSAILTLMEQLFDLLVNIIVLFFSLLFLMKLIGFSFWVVSSMSAMIIFAFVLTKISKNQQLSHNSVYDFLVRIPVIRNRLPADPEAATIKLRLPDGKLISILFSFSIIRFCASVASASIVSAVVLFNHNWWEIGATIPVAQLSFLIPLTPGALGVTEWAWSTVISLRNIPIADAVEFTVINRVLSFVATLIINFFAYIYWLVVKKRALLQSEN